MTWAAIAALAVLAAPVLGGKARMEIEQIEYFSTADDEMFPTILSLDGSGRATLTRTTNIVDPSRPVGVFVGTVPVSEVTRIAEALTSPSLDGWKARAMVPGEAYRAFRMKRGDGRVVEHCAPEGQEVPAPIVAAEAIVRTAVSAISRSPARAVSLELTGLTHHRRPDRIEAELRLVNAGREPLRLTALDGPQPANLVLDIVGGSDELPTQTFVDVEPTSVTQRPPAVEGAWMLAPGAAARITLVQAVPWLAAGKREVQAILHTELIEPAGGPPRAVELRSPKRSLRI